MVDDVSFVGVTKPRCILSVWLLRATNLWWHEVNDRRSIKYNWMLLQWLCPAIRAHKLNSNKQSLTMVTVEPPYAGDVITHPPIIRCWPTGRPVGQQIRSGFLANRSIFTTHSPRTKLADPPTKNFPYTYKDSVHIFEYCLCHKSYICHRRYINNHQIKWELFYDLERNYGYNK